MAKIAAGVYPITDRNLVLDIEADVELSGPNCRYVLSGDNGVGKTSFLEKILIPALESLRVDFLYIGQDVRYQFYTLRALLAAMGLSVIGADERELLRAWVAHSPTARVLIMDEFDKYDADCEFMFRCTKDLIEASFVVTHRDLPIDRRDLDSTVGSCRMRFEPIGREGSLKRVRVRQEPS